MIHDDRDPGRVYHRGLLFVTEAVVEGERVLIVDAAGEALTLADVDRLCWALDAWRARQRPVPRRQGQHS